MHASYLTDVFDLKKRAARVAQIAFVLRQEKIKFDSIAVMGVSGLTMGSMVAYKLNKNLVVVRKSTRTSHSCLKVEYSDSAPPRRYIIIDDLVDTGETVSKIVNNIDKAEGRAAKCVGFVMYQRFAEFKDKAWVERLVKHDKANKEWEKEMKD